MKNLLKFVFITSSFALGIVCTLNIYSSLTDIEEEVVVESNPKKHIVEVIQPNIIPPSVKTEGGDIKITTLDDLCEMVYGEDIEDVQAEPMSVAILDTGIYPHKDLQNRIIASYDVINNKELPYDDNGHGTAIAGIIGALGDGSGQSHTGIAPFVNFISVKVLNYENKGYSRDIVKGIEWVIENKDKYNIKVINISIGVPAKENDEVAAICKKAYEEGILVITSVGNITGSYIKQYSPAIEDSVITIGAIQRTESNLLEYEVSAFSQYWENVDGSTDPDVYAPGYNILTLKSDIFYRGKEELNNHKKEYEVISGTSFSTAVVTGVAMRLYQMYPEMSVEEVRRMLVQGDSKIYDENLEKYIPIICLKRRYNE